MAVIDQLVGEAPKRGFLGRLSPRSGKRKAAVANTGTNGRERRPAWLKATDELARTYVVEHEFNGVSRSEKRARRYGHRTRRPGFATLLGQRTDKSAMAYRAWVAGCRGRAITDNGITGTTYDVPTPALSADHLIAIYGSKPTPAQARRIRKARNVEVGR